MPVVRDRLTGKIVELDDNGVAKPIRQTTTGVKQSEPFNPGFTEKSELKAPTLEDRIFNAVGRYVQPGLTAIGGIAGSFGGPWTGALGSGAGSLVGKGLQTAAPGIFGQNTSTSPSDLAVDVGADILLDRTTSGLSKVMGMGFPSVRRQATQNLVKKVFPTTLPKEQANALLTDPNFKISVGQQNKLAEFLENTFAGQAKGKFVRGQEEEIGRLMEQGFKKNPESVVKEAQKSAQSNVAKMRAETKAAYEAFEPAINYNTVKLKEIIPATPPVVDPKTGIITKASRAASSRDVDIKGAVPLNKSIEFAKRVGDSIDEVLGEADSNLANIDAASGGYLKTLRTEVNKIRQVKTYIDPKTGKPAPPIAEYNQLKAVRDSLNDFVAGSRDKVLKGKLKGPLDALENTIRDDMDEAVKSWGANAYTRHRLAQDTWKNMANKVNPEMAGDLLKAGKDPETTYMMIARDALSDPEKARQFMDITKDRGTLSELYLNDLYANSVDAVKNRFDPDKALKYLHNTELVGKEAIPSYALGNLTRFLRRAQLVGPHTENANVGLKLRYATAGAALTIGSAGAVAYGTGDLGRGAQVGGLILIGGYGMHEFAKRVLLNPKMARIATNQLDADPTSKAAKIGMRSILGAMKGMQVTFMAPNKREYDAEITNDGRIKVLGARD